MGIGGYSTKQAEKMGAVVLCLLGWMVSATCASVEKFVVQRQVVHAPFYYSKRVKVPSRLNLTACSI